MERVVAGVGGERGSWQMGGWWREVEDKCAGVGGWRLVEDKLRGCLGGWRERQLADGGCALLGIQELRWTQIAADQQGHVSNMPFLMSRFFRGRNQNWHPMVMA